MQELIFLKGEERKYVLIEIYNDNIAEPDEMFEVILANPGNGAILGTPSRATVTILANDDSSGSFSFETDTAVTIEETVGDTKGVALLKIVRGPGIYGVVNLPYQVIPDVLSNNNDLSPMQNIVVFQDRQDSAVLELEAVDDNDPEQIERFTVNLLQPNNGGLLGQHVQKVIIVNPNDSPNGLIQIYARATSDKTITVDENIGLIYFDIQRTQGTDGRVTVDMATQPGTAVTDIDLSLLTLTPVQVIPAIQVVSWYRYIANGMVYVVMLTNFRVGELTSAIGSDGSAEAVNVDRLFQSTLFKWQGELIPLQTIETDIASATVSLMINNITYLVISNTGNVRRYQSKSRVYKVNNNGSLLVLQDLPTSGARDVKSFTVGTDQFLVFANSKDNNGNTLVSVNIYKWDQSIGMFTFSPWQSLASQGADALSVFQIEGVTYMVVANNYNSDQNTYLVDSIVYKLSADNKFSEHQRVRTEGAVDVTHILIRSLNLLIFANNRGDSINSPQKSWVYRWDSTTQMFFKHSELDTFRVRKMSAFIGSDDTAYLVVANSIGNSEIFYWNIQAQKFMSVWTGPPSAVMYPILVPQTTGALTLVTVGGIGATDNATLYQFSKIKDSDFSPRTITMTFEPGQKTLHTSVLIIQDDEPEETETFYVTLNNPTGGSEIGPHNMITVNILSNDNAHGIIEFPTSSLEVLVTEEDGRDNTVEISVIRKQGFFGRVTVKWSATGDQNGLSDLTPLEGTIEFANKQSVAVIVLTILNDNIAELQEVTYIHLVEIIQSGSTDVNKGAIIGPNKVSKVIVQANDSPYGVVLWEKDSIVLPEPDGTDFTQEVYITRQQGMMGQLQVAFRTLLATGYPVDRRAVSGEDYVARQSTVVMQENVTRVPVQLVIKQDDIPEADETFAVNITGVTVMGLTPPAGAEPSIKIPGNVIYVTITENDNARGSVEFDVITNIEGRIDMYEEFGKNTTVSLKVKRTIGVLGTVSVSWQAEPREATFLDFGPPSGSVTLMDGEEKGEIIITIIDDLEAEEMETFDIKLLNVVGGSTLGSQTTVRIAILKNDSPNGLFRFVQNQVTVSESTSSTDPQGEVALDIERVQGKEGVVNVQWRLNAEALYDFVDPLAGTVMFGQGETQKSILLRTKMDSILEGEEIFKVSLISADNSADISHTRGDATVVLLPDPGSAGTVKILPEYRTVYIGEPGESSPTYNGQVDIGLTRGTGIYGDIAVTWSITPRDTSAFMQIEGTVQFVDLQPTAKITLQSKDDTVPDLRKDYTLTINSASGGATISNNPGSATSTVVFVASDYPHGLFEFSLPEVTTITEDTNKINIQVIRQYGTNNIVMVSYTTTPGTAEAHKDFFPKADTLDFQHGQNQKNIEITLEQDDTPEGPEMFYINITSVRRIIPSGNNYTIINGLQLDMAPAIGSLGVKTILIQKNDNAEGTVEFGAAQFTVLEESGVAKIPVVRKGGNYGSVTVKFTVTEVSATAGVDYAVSNNEVVIDDGEMEANINIDLIDDSLMEYAEQFTITIDSILGGSLLGSVSMTTVTIAKSDYPNGMFGFRGPLEIIRENPARQEQTTLTIERSGGHQGQQTVQWRLMGPNNPQRVLLETNDIFYISNNQEKTSDSLVWSNGESGAKTVTFNIKPYSSWEIQKTFIVEIVTITGYPSTVGNGEIGPSTGKATITVKKNGDPSGIIQFSGISLTERTVEEPSSINPLQLQFPIQRKVSTGVVGSIQVFWEITGPFDDTADFQPKNGSVYIGDLQRDASFNIQILPDTLPELTETFKVILTSVEGGAEIDTSNNEAVFHIRYNDHPHGLFGLIQSQQVINVDPSDLVRSILLNFTRHEGSFGSIILTFAIGYDIPQSGIVLSNSGGTVTFVEGQTSVLVKIHIEGSGFLAIDTTFTATLITVNFLGAGVTEPPKFKPGETEAKISVPTAAANSVIGFQDSLAAIDEITNTATITLKRIGTYGTVNIPWQIGYPSGQEPATGTLGNISPQTGTVTIPHGGETKDFSITTTALPDRVEYFVLHLPHTPSTTVPGGSKLDTTQTLVKMEPHGIIRFAANSTNPLVSEMDENAYLLVQRVYGSEGKIEVTYRSQDITADKGIDYITVETNAIIMEPGQISALILVQVLQDNHPEEEETFHINFTHVEKYPTELVPKISPRLSSLHSGSLVRIEESNDPYGIVSIEPLTVSVDEEPIKVNLNIQRTGGIFGTISVVVRTVGGGEPWTSQIVASSSDTNDTIAQVLGNRNSENIATGGDYEILDTMVTFLQGEVTKQVSVSILTDNIAEPDETVIVYLTQPTGGARIALGTPDGGKKGFSIITILKNDISNGIIGFSESSKVITVNEDTAPTFSLQLTRMNAKFGEVLVSWQAKISLTSTQVDDVVLADQLVKTAGSVMCPAQQSLCTFDVSLKEDEIPEEEIKFIIQLTSAEPQAELDYSSTVSNITVQTSDYVRGLLQFTEDTRIKVVKKDSASVQLKVERVKGRDYDVDVSYQTDQMNNKRTLYDIDIFPAYESEDFSQANGVLTFVKNTQIIEHIDVSLTPASSLSPSYPKQLYVILKNPSNGASVHPDLSFSRATILIVEESNLLIWTSIIEQDKGSLQNDTDILKTLSTLDLVTKNDLDDTELSLVEKILENILDEGLTRQLPDEILNAVLNILCDMLNPSRSDATRGRSSLGLLVEKLAYCKLTGKPCSTPDYPAMSSLQYCLYAKISAARWPLQKIHNFHYKAQRDDSFTIPDEIVDPPSPQVGDCVDFHMIEYSSELWFMTSDSQQLLSNKVINFGIKGRPSTYTDKPAVYRIHTPDRRIATSQAQCVFYDYASKDWVSPTGWCHVTNDLVTAMNDYVDCSCKHLTNYAVKATALDPGIVGYSEWFYIACFFCMIGMALTILVHHIYSMLHAMFSANLLMHMCFACFATQLCYIVSAYGSPDEILVYNKFENNYRCIVMGIFLHYFFLAQFTWILAQSINYWKILVMNDEHTDRKYVLFFLIGWGSPAVMLAIFYTITYNLYRYVYNLPVDHIYGDVNNNGQICFIVNAYAGLGGVIIPVILILVAIGIIFMKAFQLTPQWQAYDDIYRGRYNINEIRTLLSFWGVITLTWFWGGLHLAYGQLWMMILFCIFNILQGVMVLVLYTILRNPCMQKCFGPQKSNYPVNTGTDGLSLPSNHTNVLDIGSLKGSRASILNESWEKDSLHSKSTMKVKRTLPFNRNIYVTPPVLIPSTTDDNQDEDLDELLFALKNDSFVGSETSSIVSGKTSDISSKIDKYEMRRISIADTHL